MDRPVAEDSYPSPNDQLVNAPVVTFLIDVAVDNADGLTFEAVHMVFYP